MQQASDRPIHVLPFVGAAIQGIEQDQEIDTLPIEFDVALEEETFHRLRIVFDELHALGPRTPPAQGVTVLREVPSLHRTPDAARSDAVRHQASQHTLARIVVRRRRNAESFPHLRLSTPRLRKTSSAPGLLRGVRKTFDEVPDPMPGRKFSLSDCVMSGLAVFGLKSPSLLRFDRDARTDETVRANLKSLYGIERAPCDTALRERLDEVSPRKLRAAFTWMFAQLQRGKALEGFTCLDGHSLLSVDATGYFSSSSVHCEHCCETHASPPITRCRERWWCTRSAARSSPSHRSRS